MSHNANKNTCIVCGKNLSASDKYPGLLQCDSCDFLTADVNMSDDELAKLYGHDYFHDGEYGNYLSEKTALQLNFKHRLNLISSLPAIGTQSKIFEIGCAYGFFLELLKGLYSKSAGIDISENAVKYAKDELNVDAHHGNFLEFHPDFSPDVVCMWDVIEHLKNPREILEQANKITADNGYILITTGDVRSLNARIRGPKWRLVHPPTHLHYFSKKSIETMLKDVGYENIQFSYPSVWRTFGTIFHATVGQKLGLRKMMADTFIEDIPIPLNLFDIMLVSARKCK